MTSIECNFEKMQILVLPCRCHARSSFNCCSEIIQLSSSFNMGYLRFGLLAQATLATIRAKRYRESVRNLRKQR